LHAADACAVSETSAVREGGGRGEAEGREK